jgi:tripartite-type tricarboxylate transporter receptor subunit TctC
MMQSAWARVPRRAFVLGSFAAFRVAALFAVLVAVLGATPAKADGWPNRVVRFVVPFAAGGSGDTLARIVAAHLSTALKQQVIVENRPGGGGIVGTEQFVAAPPDGYTIGMSSLSTISLVPIINPKGTYDPLRDFTHIAYIGGAPVVLAANPQTGVNTLQDFVAYTKKPGKAFTFASSGVGSDGHLAGEEIALSMQVPPEHVPYKATAQALTDLVAGHIPFSTFTLSSTAPFLRSKALNGIAVTSLERMPEFLDIPTFKELGHPELVGTTWFALSGPAKLPEDVVDTLNREVIEAVATADVQARFRRDGFIAQPMSPAQFTAFVAAENAKWKLLIEKAGLAAAGR